MTSACTCGRVKDTRAVQCRPCSYDAGRYHFWTAETCVEALRAWAEKHGRPPTANTDWHRAGYGQPNYRTVARLCGSWNAGLRAAGLSTTPAGPRPRWTKDAIAAAMLDFVLREGRWPRVVEWERAFRPDESPRPNNDTVYRVFGTWNAAKRYAGWVQPRDRRKSPPGLCVGCGTDFDNFTSGCLSCKERRRARARTAKTETSATHSRESAPVSDLGGIAA